MMALGIVTLLIWLQIGLALLAAFLVAVKLFGTRRLQARVEAKVHSILHPRRAH